MKRSQFSSAWVGVGLVIMGLSAASHQVNATTNNFAIQTSQREEVARASATQEVRGRVVGAEADGLLRVEFVGDILPVVGDSTRFIQPLGDLEPLPAGTGVVISVEGNLARVKVLTGTPNPGVTAVISVANPIMAADRPRLAEALSALQVRLRNPSPPVVAALALLTEQVAGRSRAQTQTDEIGAGRVYVLLRIIENELEVGVNLRMTLERIGAIRGDGLGTSCTHFTGDPAAPAAQTKAGFDQRVRQPLDEGGATIAAAWRLFEAEGAERLTHLALRNSNDSGIPALRRRYVERFDEQLQLLTSRAEEFLQGQQAAEEAMDALMGALDQPRTRPSQRACATAIRAFADVSRAIARVSDQARILNDWLRP
jgi:hypothetical protein